MLVIQPVRAFGGSQIHICIMFIEEKQMVQTIKKAKNGMKLCYYLPNGVNNNKKAKNGMKIKPLYTRYDNNQMQLMHKN